MLETMLTKEIFNNSVLNYLMCFGALILGYITVSILKKIFYVYLDKKTDKESPLRDIVVALIKKVFFPISLWVVVYISVQFINLHTRVDKFIYIISVFILTYYAIKFFIEVLNYIVKYHIKTEKEDVCLENKFGGIVFVLKIVIWAFSIIFLLDNLGFNVSTVVTGLGIGGIAIGLAAQAVLKDLFSYFSIILDKPFEIGDFVILDSFMGTIEHIGFKTTRVRSLGGEQLVFSNTDLTDSRVRNYKRMQKRRIAFKLGVTYNTSVEKLKEIPVIIKDIIENIEDTVFDRSNFCKYADCNLEFETVYYLLTSNYNVYMQKQEQINLRIKEEFDSKKIEFAFPTYTIHMNK